MTNVRKNVQFHKIDNMFSDYNGTDYNKIKIKTKLKTGGHLKIS